MPFIPVKGKFAKITLVGSPDKDLPARNWSLNVDGNVQDTSNFRDGRHAEATLDDADLSFELVYDEDTDPTSTAGGSIRPGTVFSAKCFVNNAATKFYLVPAVIATINPKNDGPATIMAFAVTAKLRGSVTYPA
jgi:hypothetical protein